MTVVEWDTCEYCERPILLWSSGMWYDGGNRFECASSGAYGIHFPISQSIDYQEEKEESND